MAAAQYLVVGSVLFFTATTISQAEPTNQVTVLDFGARQRQQQLDQENQLRYSLPLDQPEMLGGQGGQPMCGVPPYLAPCPYTAGNGSIAPYNYNGNYNYNGGGGAYFNSYGNSAFPAQSQQQTPWLQNQQNSKNDVTFPAQKPFVDLSPSSPAVSNGGYGNNRDARGSVVNLDGLSRNDVMNPDSFSQDQNNEPKTIKGTQIEKTAYQVGLRAGFMEEADKINKALLTHGRDLTAHFNFGTLMEGNGLVVPPVITVATGIAERKSANRLVLVTGTYEIVSSAYVSLKTIGWEDYLLFTSDKNNLSSPIPHFKFDAKSKKLWSKAAGEGWDRGVEEARLQFKSSFKRMQRDYKGMKKYHELAKEGVVSLTNVNFSEKNGAIYRNGRKVTGNEINVDIVVQPVFKNQKRISKIMANEAK